ncbi:hypothetical protein [Streptomyces yanii]|uniref:Uncharacterized protein n=1 Tax=Streptomyces yanii TaxID=78510 RepID=A0ABV5R262_9ACTN
MVPPLLGRNQVRTSSPMVGLTLMSLQLDVAVTEPDAGHLAGTDSVLVNDLAVPRQDCTAVAAGSERLDPIVRVSKDRATTVL